MQQKGVVMEWLDASMTDNSGPKLGLLCLQRYYFFYRKQFLPYNHKWTLFCHFLEIAQLLALLIPKDSARSLPWNYSLCGPLWAVLSFLSLPDALLEQLRVSPALITALYAAVVGSKVVAGIAVAVLLGLMDNPQFANTINESRTTLLQRPLFLLNYLLNLLFRLLSLPMVAFWTSQISTLQASYQLAYIGLVLLAIGSRVVDTAYIGNTTWFQGDLESIAVCSDRIYLFLAKLVHVFICSAVNYNAHSYYFAAGLIVTGLYSALKVIYRVPFHDIRMNCLVLIKAEISLWGGVCLLIGNLDASAQDMMKSTLLFFLLFPGLTVLFATQIGRKLKSSLTAEHPIPLYQVEHCVRLLLTSASASESIDEVFRRAFLLYPSSPQLVVWSLYYYQHLEDVTFVQVSMSRLLKQHWNLIYFVECLFCVFIVEDWLHSLPEQAEALGFMTFQQALKKATEADNEASRAHYELFSELATKSPNKQRVTHLAETLGSRMKLSTRIYQQLLQSHPNSSEVLQRYSTFLTSLTSSKAAFKYQTLAQRELSRMHAKRSDQTVDLYDPSCMIVAMSLEKQSIGLITWVQNSELLGFSRVEVMGADHTAVIPPPIKANHIEKLRRITEFRHHHPVYESRHLLYFSNREGFLVGAYWKVRLINMPGSGDMTIIAALKKRRDAPAIAFVGEDLSTVVAVVSPNQTKAFKKAISPLFPHGFPAVFTLSQAFGPVHDLWQEGKTVCECRELGKERFLIKCEVISIFGLHKQPVLKLYYELVATALHTYSRPVMDHSTSVIDEELEKVLWTSTPAFIASDLKASSVLNVPNHSSSHKNTTVFESLTGLGTTTAELSDPPGYLKKLYKGKKEALERTSRGLDWGIAALTLFIMAFMLAMALGNVNSELFGDRLDSLASMNTRRELVLLAAMKAREPFLLKSGFSPPSSLTMTQIIDQLHAQAAQIAEKSDSDPSFRRIHYNTKGVWWEFTPDGALPLLRNAVEMVTLLASHALPLAQDWKSDFQDGNFKAVYRNGPGDCLSVLNQTLNAVLTQGFEAAQDLEAQLLSQLLAGLFSLCAGLGLALCFALKRVSSLHKAISAILNRLPTSLYTLAKASSRDRLVDFHDADASDLDLDLNMGSVKLRTGLCGDTFRLITSGMVLLAILIFGLIGLFVLLREQVTVYEIQLPGKVEISGLRRLALIASLFYLRESHTTAHYSQVFPAFQQTPCPVESATQQTDMLEYYEAFLMQADLTESHLSAAMLAYQFQTAGTGFLRYGTHGAVVQLGREIALFARRTEVGKEEFGDLERRISETLTALDVLTKEYSAVGKRELQRQSQLLWGMALITGAGFVAGYGLLLRREVRKKSQRAQDLWRVLLFLPRQTALELCKRLQ